LVRQAKAFWRWNINLPKQLSDDIDTVVVLDISNEKTIKKQ